MNKSTVNTTYEQKHNIINIKITLNNYNILYKLKFTAYKMPRFCPKCRSSMRRIFGSTNFVMECIVCHHREDALPEDVSIGGGAVRHDDIASSMSTFLKKAAFDQVNLKVSVACECGLPYMTVVRIGSSESVFYVCKCGKIIST